MSQTVLWTGDTSHGHYEVVDTVYDGRSARVLYSGDRQAAQSGLPHDDKPDLLFDYNQRFFELATNVAPRRLLLIGGGVGTLATALLKALPELTIDMVEPDEQLIALGHRFFDLPDSARLRCYAIDGRAFLRRQPERYDLIIIDAFKHTTIPRELKTLQAFTAYAKHLRPSGVLACNVISVYHGPGSQVLGAMYAAALQVFNAVDIFLAGRGYSLWLPQNFVLTAQEGGDWPLQDYLRHEAVPPLEVSPNAVLYDEVRANP